jgi:hypothetical protein
VTGQSGMPSTDSSQAKTSDINGASRKREPHDNVQDRAQKNFPSNGFAGHAPLVPIVVNR